MYSKSKTKAKRRREDVPFLCFLLLLLSVLSWGCASVVSVFLSLFLLKKKKRFLSPSTQKEERNRQQRRGATPEWKQKPRTSHFFFVQKEELNSNLVDSASGHTLVSKIKPCICELKRFLTVKLWTAHYIGSSLFGSSSCVSSFLRGRARKV